MGGSDKESVCRHFVLSFHKNLVRLDQQFAVKVLDKNVLRQRPRHQPRPTFREAKSVVRKLRDMCAHNVEHVLVQRSRLQGNFKIAKGRAHADGAARHEAQNGKRHDSMALQGGATRRKIAARKQRLAVEKERRALLEHKLLGEKLGVLGRERDENVHNRRRGANPNDARGLTGHVDEDHVRLDDKHRVVLLHEGKLWKGPGPAFAEHALGEAKPGALGNLLWELSPDSGKNVLV